jgi:V/A-type H+-transporting ATPase subunit E
METVKTSEAIEAQIREDARVKARRVVEAAQKEADSIRAEADGRAQEELRRLDAAREARRAAMRADLEASVPLDLKRLRLQFLQKKVDGALEDLYRGMDTHERDRVIGGLVARAAPALAHQRLAVRCSGIAPEEARRIVTASISGAEVHELTPLPPEEAEEAGVGLIVETADGNRRLRATLKELTALLLEEDREELVTALFGKDVQT